MDDDDDDAIELGIRASSNQQDNKPQNYPIYCLILTEIPNRPVKNQFLRLASSWCGRRERDTKELQRLDLEEPTIRSGAVWAQKLENS